MTAGAVILCIVFMAKINLSKTMITCRQEHRLFGEVKLRQKIDKHALESNLHHFLSQDWFKS